MRSFISLSIAALLLTTTLTHSVSAQQAKSSTKARKAKTAKVQTPSAPSAPAKPTTPPVAPKAKTAKTPVLSTPTPDDGAQRITVAELRAALDNGTAILVDVRSDDAYKAEHIKGAILLPVYEMAARYKELPKNKLIATYCS